MRTAALLVGALLAAACTADDDEPGFSADQLRQGVSLIVDDEAQAIESAAVLLPDDLPSYPSYLPQMAYQSVVVMQPGEGGYDVVVMYMTGPFCGIAPGVVVTGDQDQLDVAIDTKSSGDCDAMEYAEAVGLNLLPGFESARIAAHQV